MEERPGIGKAYLFPSPKDPSKPLRYELGSDWLREAERLAGLPRLRTFLTAKAGARFLAGGSVTSGARYFARAFAMASVTERLGLVRQYGPFTLRQLARAGARGLLPS